MGSISAFKLSSLKQAAPLKPFALGSARPINFVFIGGAALFGAWLVGLGPFALLVYFSQPADALPLFSGLRIFLTVILGAITALTAFSIWLLGQAIYTIARE